MDLLLLLQERALHRGVDVICATPGRLNDHFERGNFVRCSLTVFSQVYEPLPCGNTAYKSK